MSVVTRTAVLVHGAWAGESSWDKVVDLLQKNQVNVVTVRLPLTSLGEDTTALDRALESVAGPVVLVGHAYAGAVIASIRSEKVRALVYIAGIAPDEGETVAEVFNRYGHDDRVPALAPGSDGLIRLPFEAFGTAFAQHATADEQKALAATQPPISPQCITEPMGRPLWKDVPTWYLLAEQDYMIPEKTQRYVAERMQARIRAYPVDHVPSVTAPGLVEDIILAALRHASA